MGFTYLITNPHVYISGLRRLQYIYNTLQDNHLTLEMGSTYLITNPHVYISGLRRLQYIYNTLKDNHLTVDMGFRRLDDITAAHDDLRRLDRHDQHAWKNVILDMSSQEAYRQILKQVMSLNIPLAKDHSFVK